jgi:UDP-glucuronate decarboxylase
MAKIVILEHKINPDGKGSTMRHDLVTGGAGFIGHQLCSTLLDSGADVLCIDNFLTGSKDNIREFFGHPYFELIRHDIIYPLFAEVDRIYHLACPASPIHYQKNAIKTVKTNVLGTINMLGLAKRTGARILLASTSEVYGMAEISPQPEEYLGNVNPIGVRSCYDEGKRIAETLMMDYHRQNGVDIKIVRIFNTYGPGMAFDDGRVVSNFIIQALKGEPLTVYGRGNQTRSFCYVDDLLKGLTTMMEKEDFLGPVNLGNPHEIQIIDLAHLIKDLTKSKSPIIYSDLPADDPVNRQPDISLAKSQLGWEPNTKLETGLEKTIESFRQRLPAIK